MHNLKLMRPIGGRGGRDNGLPEGVGECVCVGGGGGVTCMHKVKA